ncbi:hypothetical protein BH743_12065 [Enterococcus faecium]|uniref:pectate lyase-like adhesive domain-containing protein n=1 Tax=Enterococcus faecium TaxID=1352 RepID=UPI0009BF7336|nr:pectate lyase-like adhesive domain-containing protein [Enterococcus faecium]OQO64482.1 hypothetical protein BH743_12065 [Enterococcus faecium]
MKKVFLAVGISTLFFSFGALNSVANTVDVPESISNTESDTIDHNDSGSSEAISDLESSESIISTDEGSTSNEETYSSDEESTNISSNEVDIVASEEDNSLNTAETTQVTDTFNKGTRISTTVFNVAELRQALTEASVDTIILGQDIDIKDASLSVTRNITIDGDGHTITYGNDSGATMLATNGIHFTNSHITIHYKNVNFGFKDKLGTQSTRNANNYYGIAPATHGQSDLTLIVENVNYYSDYGAQPFHINHQGNQIIFKGTNEFIMQGKANTNSQEFAEATNIIFDEGSSTTIRDENMVNTGFIWAHYEPLTFSVRKNANVNITTAHDFLYQDSTGASINVEEGGMLKINQLDTLAPSATGKFIHQSSKPITINTGINSVLDIRTKNTSSYSNFTTNLGVDTITQFASGNGPVISSNSLTSFNLDNIERLTFKSENSTVGKTGSVGSTNGSIAFKNFLNSTSGYDVFINNEVTALTTQLNTSTWRLSSAGFTRETPDFTSETKTALNAAGTIVITKHKEIDNPTKLSWDSSTEVKQLVDEIIEGQGWSGSFYWKDIDNGDNIVFQLWNENEKISDMGEVTSTGANTFSNINCNIDKDKLLIGENKFFIKAFKKLKDGTLSFSDQLTLDLKVTAGSLSFISIPESLNWTDRLISESKGTLIRDSGNTMEIKVSDTRVGNHSWEVTAAVEGNSSFSLVWKDDTNYVDDLDGKVVLTKDQATKDDYTYSKSWNETQGVLLESNNYMAIGDYSNQLAVTWTLNDVASVE